MSLSRRGFLQLCARAAAVAVAAPLIPKAVAQAAPVATAVEVEAALPTAHHVWWYAYRCKVRDLNVVLSTLEQPAAAIVAPAEEAA